MPEGIANNVVHHCTSCDTHAREAISRQCRISVANSSESSFTREFCLMVLEREREGGREVREGRGNQGTEIPIKIRYLLGNNGILARRYHRGIIFIRYNLRDSAYSRPKGHSRNNEAIVGGFGLELPPGD